MKQTQAQRHEEKIIFAAFYELQPDFAGEPIEDWKLADCDPPDIVCTAVSGKRIGVELGEWLHFGEMEAGKLREAIERQLLDAIGEPQPLNTSRHFDMVILHPRDRVRITTSRGKASFRAAMISLIADVDRRWPAERSWHYAPGCRIKDLSNWPPLDRYLESVHFHPGQSQWTEGINWILPAAHVFIFDNTTMITPLACLLSEKIAKYRTRPMATPCDELVLLVFFNQGVMYNPPIQTPRRTAEMVVDEVRKVLPQDHGPFSIGYLFLAPTPGARAFRLW